MKNMLLYILKRIPTKDETTSLVSLNYIIIVFYVTQRGYVELCKIYSPANITIHHYIGTNRNTINYIFRSVLYRRLLR